MVPRLPVESDGFKDADSVSSSISSTVGTLYVNVPLGGLVKSSLWFTKCSYVRCTDDWDVKVESSLWERVRE
jgi:hypothetical protein